LRAGTAQIALGLVFFVVAVVISLTKAGVAGRWAARRTKAD